MPRVRSMPITMPSTPAIWLEPVLKVNVLRRWRRLLLTLLPVLVVFVLWDLAAIAAGHWTFDPEQTTGVLFPGGRSCAWTKFGDAQPIQAQNASHEMIFTTCSRLTCRGTAAPEERAPRPTYEKCLRA